MSEIQIKSLGLGSSFVIALGMVLIGPAVSLHAENPVQRENLEPGDADWQLTRVWLNASAYRTSLIEGYCSKQSVHAGESIDVFVSTRPDSKFTLDVYRMGFYGGAGARKYASFGPLSGEPQPVPDVGKNRLRECRWESSLSIQIPASWLSGVYLGKLTTVPESDQQPYWQSYIVFVVTDARPADVVFQCSDNTWQAYNRWPANDSLYTHPDGAQKPGVSVSFDRPYGMYCQIYEHPLSVGSGEFLLWEYPLCYWLEGQGYDVTYVSNVDVQDPKTLDGRSVFLSVGHDEYWDLKQYETVKGGIENGTNVLWLSANSVYMVSPFSSSSSGAENRILTRVGSYGPLRTEEVQTYGKIMGPFEQFGPDEREIIGARSIVPFNGGGDWICSRPNHWIFEGTELRDGDRIQGLVGWEHHGDPDPDRAGLVVVGEGTTWAGGTRPSRWTATIFDGPKGNIVFNAATIFWSQGLASPPGHILPWSHYSRPHGPDARVQRITENLLQHCIGETK